MATTATRPYAKLETVLIPEEEQQQQEGDPDSSTTQPPPHNLHQDKTKTNAMTRMRRNTRRNHQEEKPRTAASWRDTLAFIYDDESDDDNKHASRCGLQIIFATGVVGAIVSGLVYPAMAFFLADSLSILSNTASSDASLAALAQMAYNLMIVGVVTLISGLMQGWCFEIVAHCAARNFSRKWFEALLRQDAAFFDVYDVGALAGQIGPSALKYQRGVGRKLGEAIQFFITGIGGLVFSFYSSWRVALVILLVFPVVACGIRATQYYNVTTSQRAAKYYERAGGIAYSAVSAIKTVLSLNAVPEMIRQYDQATKEAFHQATLTLCKKGLANASFTASFLTLYVVLTLYGSSLLYKEVAKVGCDPSASVVDNAACGDSAPKVFAAMMGVAFAAQGVAGFGNCLGMIEDARVAAGQAQQAMQRQPGATSEVIYQETSKDDDQTEEEGHGDDSDVDDGNLEHSSPRRFSRTWINQRSDRRRSGTSEQRQTGRRKSSVIEQPLSVANGRKVKGILPRYEIDSMSPTGLKPTNVHGAISIKDVHFSYPTRPNVQVFDGISAEIKAASIVAFVGPSGGGKSTVVSLLERFYDPQSGSIELDGVNIKDWNVKHLRGLIGFVGQEPALFATTIRQNIQYGNPNATKEEIEEAARLANAHDFISSFSEGYETQVGDKGSQLSGGQKQRIAIARILVANPKILLLDEATSALDAESELVVQEALDNIVAHKNITTIIVAHRLSTIRHADKINVIVAGRLIGTGTHNELMETSSYYRKLVEKQEGVDSDELNSSSSSPSRQSSSLDMAKLDEIDEPETLDPAIAHVSFKNVSFAYPTRPQKTVLNQFNLEVQQGQTVAIVGESGGGKSTTAGLLERFYDPLEGSVEYFGADIKTLNVSWYRDQIGYVGQEPTLFDDTIARNIAYGSPGASQAEIEEACRQANAHDFIVEFPDGYDTPVGQGGAQLSGGQKQRVAIARALVKKPKLLILDEATSALDSESEAIVQAAISNLMMSSAQTKIVIAHRLSTIRDADKIAFITSGRVTEFGSHDELLRIPHGRYGRLVESSKLKASVANVGLENEQNRNKKSDGTGAATEETIDWEADAETEAAKSFNLKRARGMAEPDFIFLLAGAIGALLGGGVYPLWGVLFSEMIGLLFQRVEACPAADGTIPSGFETCQDYWYVFADDMQQRSFEVAWHWATLIAACIIGTVLSIWSFGMASERLNKRVRDASFEALLRQEIGYFDKRSVGGLTSQLEDDAARIHLFTDEPIRQVCVALASVVIGVLLSFILMWPFALLAVATLPLMMFAVSQRMKTQMGSDQGVYVADELNSPGGIIVETLLNMRTVSALTLEQQRFDDFKKASRVLDNGYRLRSFTEGLSGALGMFVRQWIMALQLWFCGYLMFTFPNDYSFQDFLISTFAMMFSLFGLATAFQDMKDQKTMRESAGRIFALLDRQSAIDPLSNEGKVL